MNIIWTIVLSSLTAMVVPAAVAFVFKDFIAKWIGSRVQYGFDVKLADLNGRIKAQQESDSALRTGALSVLSKQHESLNERIRLACENLWADVQHDKRYDFFLYAMSSVNFSKTSEIIEKNNNESDNIKLFFNTIWKSSGIDEIQGDKRVKVSLERIYIPDDIYRAYIAYTSISSHVIARVMMVRNNVSPSMIKEKEDTAKAIKAALPHKAAFVDQYELESYVFLRDDLERFMLERISAALMGPARALTVVRSSAEVINEALVSGGVVPPPVPESIFKPQ